MGNLPAKFENDAPKPVSFSVVQNKETNNNRINEMSWCGLEDIDLNLS